MKHRWLLWLLMIAFVWVIVSRFAEIQKLANILFQGQWQWVLIAAVLQVLYFIIFTGLYQAAFDTVEVKSRIRDLLPLTLASVFLNVVAPSGGVSGAAIFVEDARQRGQSPARAAEATLLVIVADLSTFTLVLLAGLAHLFLVHNLQIYEILGTFVLLAMVGGLAGILLLGLWQPGRLKGILEWLQHTVNRLAGLFWHKFSPGQPSPGPLPEGWAEEYANEFSRASLAIATHPKRLQRTLATALVAQIVDLASLYTLFLAFHQPVGLGTLIAGFAIGILFWIISITPQGIGVVEGVMALVYTSLGVPAEKAIIISLAFRGLTFWLPFAIGFFTLRRIRAFSTSNPPRYQGKYIGLPLSIRLVSLLTGLMGIINVVDAVTPRLPTHLASVTAFFPLEIRHGGHLTSALAGFALLLLAGSLWRRKRVALLITLVVLVGSTIIHLLKGLFTIQSFISVLLAIWLLYLSPQFHARSDPPSMRQGLISLAASLGFTLAYGVIGFYLLDLHFKINGVPVRFGLWAALRQTLIMFTQFYNPGLQPITGFGRYFAGSIYIVGAITLSYATLMLLRPVILREPATHAERERARHIVEAYGCSSLARLTLLDDKYYYFSPGGSVIAFVVESRVALALGDPIGPAEDLSACIAGFQGYCSKNDWQPAFYQVLPDHLPVYDVLGFSSVNIGQEAVVDVADFTLAGRANKGLRSAVNRMKKLGFRPQVHQPPLSPGLLHELRMVSDEWLASMRGTEKRFSLGWFDDDYLRNGPVIVINNPDGRIEAFGNIVPEYQCNEITIDLMRHRRNAEHGIMDYLFVSLIQWAKEQGYGAFDLGLSALAGIGEGAGATAIERTLHFIYEHVNQFYNFKGLHEFKEKFNPRWSPRYLVYPGPADLPLVALALIRADSGGSVLRSFIH